MNSSYEKGEMFKSMQKVLVFFAFGLVLPTVAWRCHSTAIQGERQPSKPVRGFSPVERRQASEVPPRGQGAARSVVHRAPGGFWARRVRSENVEIVPSSVRAGETVTITVNESLSPNAKIRWTSTTGVIGGRGLRVNFTPGPDFVGTATVLFETRVGNRVDLVGRFSVGVQRRRPKLVLHKIESKRPGQVIVHGRAEGLANPKKHRVAAYVHSDVFYKLKGHHVFPLDDSGAFRFKARQGPSLDRLVVHLIEKNVDPNGPEHCPGTCVGHFDRARGSGARVPLRMDSEGSLAFASHSFRGSRDHQDPQIRFLLNHFSLTPLRGAPKSARLIRSYGNNDQLFLYDQALAVLAFSLAGERAAARRVLDALKYLQIRENSERDGAWNFAYYSNGASANETKERHGGPDDGHLYSDRRVSGAIAWVGMALNGYRLKFEDDRYDDMWHRVMAYLARTRMPVTVQGVESQALRFQQEDLPRTAWDESATAALVHNLDGYSALHHYARLAKRPKFEEMAAELRRFAESLWVHSQKGFYAGFDGLSAKVNAEDLYLDPQTWGLLAFANSPKRVARYAKGLERACALFFEPAGYISAELSGIPGFFDWRPLDPSQSTENRRFVWTEGTLGYVLAAQIVAQQTGKKQVCERYGARYDHQDLLKAMGRLQDEHGGVPYATRNRVPRDFNPDASVAGTAWLYFANRGFNPFHPDF